jgi:hypothetical protein
MTRLALVLQVLFALGALFSAVQFAHRRFLIPTLGTDPLQRRDHRRWRDRQPGATPSPEAFLAGGVSVRPWARSASNGGGRVGSASGSCARHVDPAVREYLTLALPLMIGQTVIALDEQWPRAFGQFGPDGTTAGLQYGGRLMMLPVGVIAQAAGVAAYPFLAVSRPEATTGLRADRGPVGANRCGRRGPRDARRGPPLGCVGSPRAAVRRVHPSMTPWWWHRCSRSMRWPRRSGSSIR